jgi:hypothetical protein
VCKICDKEAAQTLTKIPSEVKSIEGILQGIQVIEENEASPSCNPTLRPLMRYSDAGPPIPTKWVNI